MVDQRSRHADQHHVSRLDRHERGIEGEAPGVDRERQDLIEHPGHDVVSGPQAGDALSIRVDPSDAHPTRRCGGRNGEAYVPLTDHGNVDIVAPQSPTELAGGLHETSSVLGVAA